MTYIAVLRRFNLNVRLFLVGAAIIGLTNFGGIFAALFNLYLLRLGYGTQFIGTVNAIGAFALVATCWPASALERRFGSRNLVLAGLVLNIVSVDLHPHLVWRRSGFYGHDHDGTDRPFSFDHHPDGIHLPSLSCSHFCCHDHDCLTQHGVDRIAGRVHDPLLWLSGLLSHRRLADRPGSYRILALLTHAAVIISLCTTLNSTSLPCSPSSQLTCSG